MLRRREITTRHPHNTRDGERTTGGCQSRLRTHPQISASTVESANGLMARMSNVKVTYERISHMGQGLHRRNGA